MPRMASKIIMSCMVPIFTRITLKVKFYRLLNHEQINVSNHKAVSHGKHRMISLNMTIMMLVILSTSIQAMMEDKSFRFRSNNSAQM